MMENIIINGTTIECEHNIYTLRKTSNDLFRPISKNNNACNKFDRPESSNSPKIYIVISLNNLIYYIGKTNQSMSTRLRQGINPQGNSGYHGYKWKNTVEFKLHCITLPVSLELGLEAIEAEMVYNYRCLTGCWPLYQTEIHFHNDENIKELAKKLFTILNSKLYSIEIKK